jgi:hypothetical protein
MNPMRLITYALLTGVFTLVMMGGVGFYIGYSAGRGDLEEIKALIAASVSPEGAAQVSELLKKQAEGASQTASAPDFSPVLDEIRSISKQIGKLEQGAPQPAPATAEAGREDPRLRDELASLRQRLAAATDQHNVCRQDVNLLQAKLKESQTQATQVAATSAPKSGPESRDPTSVVLFDNVQLKRDQNKLYNDVDVALSLQSVASRSARVAVNQQSFGIAFGERKIFQHRDVTCELVLMETDLEGNQARLSIACKR